MEIIETEGIKIPNSVIVSGLTETESDDELFKVLKQYGSFAKTVRIDDKESEFYRNVIIEYDGDQALQSLGPQLPYVHQLSTEPGIKCHVRALASVFTQQLGSSITKSYLDRLKEIAELSGNNFESILSEMLSQMSADLTPGPTEPGSISRNACEKTYWTSPDGNSDPILDPPSQIDDVPSQPIPIDLIEPTLRTSSKILNPPEVQRLVVEHVVRSGEVAVQGQVQPRLRVFSGKCPRPGNEVDYDIWRSSVEFILKDPSLSDLHVSRRILDSLLPPAADVIRHLNPESPPSAYLQLLDSAFGAVEDGDELLAKFMNTLQDAGERPSTYLYRLQSALRATVKRGGVSPEEADRHLLKQFCRGCWDNDLITELRLEQKRNNPPSFAQLLLMLRTEEDRHTAKATRMKQHLGSSKQRALMHSQKAWVSAELEQNEGPRVSPLETETRELKKQIVKLQSQLANLTIQTKHPKKAPSKEVVKRPASSDQKKSGAAASVVSVNRKPTDRPRPWYCFTCGEDGHIASSCTSEPNPELVATKRKLLREKQLQWDSQNSIDSSDLN